MSPSHPLSVFPWGNIFTCPDKSSSRSSTLGLFGLLSDSLISRILDLHTRNSKPIVAARTLLNFAQASSFTRAFAYDDELWRTLLLSHFPPSVLSHFHHSYRATFINLLISRSVSRGPRTASPVFSDILFHKWRCATHPISPEWIKHNDIQVINIDNISVDEFRDRFERPGVPIVIQGATDGWRAQESWTWEKLEKLCGGAEFNANGYQMHLKDYLHYMRAVRGKDDQPLYIFDPAFAEKVPALAEMYQVPNYFADDLFRVFGKGRPHFRWLIIGPERSGSLWHKDPNATSAWNAVIKGEKKWVMFPPNVTPPGVVASTDGGSVTGPVSVVEWFVNFYNRDEVRRNGGLECTVKEGEVMFIPRGWWHCVLNTQDCIAVTQNYVSRTNVREVAKWVKERPDQVSGCGSEKQKRYVQANFASLVVRDFPELEEKVRDFVQGNKVKGISDEVSTKKRRVGLWMSLQTKKKLSNPGMDAASGSHEVSVHSGKADDVQPTGFTFGF